MWKAMNTELSYCGQSTDSLDLCPKSVFIKLFYCLSSKVRQICIQLLRWHRWRIRGNRVCSGSYRPGEVDCKRQSLCIRRNHRMRWQLNSSGSRRRLEHQSRRLSCSDLVDSHRRWVGSNRLEAPIEQPCAYRTILAMLIAGSKRTSNWRTGHSWKITSSFKGPRPFADQHS